MAAALAVEAAIGFMFEFLVRQADQFTLFNPVFIAAVEFTNELGFQVDDNVLMRGAVKKVVELLRIVFDIKELNYVPDRVINQLV